MFKLHYLKYIAQAFANATVELKDETAPGGWIEISFQELLALRFEGEALGNRMLIEFNEVTKEFAVACSVIARIKEAT